MFEPGISGNPAGKPKGAKSNTEIKERIANILDANFSVDQVSQDLSECNAHQRLQILIKLLPFITAQMKAVENTNEEHFDSLVELLRKPDVPFRVDC